MSSHTHSNSQDGQQQQQHGGGLFARLRGTAEAALAKVPQYNEMEHYLRQASVQANPRQSRDTLQHQLAVKGLKGVIIDHEAVARETKNYSKNILDFVRGESKAPGSDVADIQDVGDRLAFLTYKAGELHEAHAKQLENARIALKDIRNFENQIGPQREKRAQLEREIGKLRTSSKPDTATNKKLEALQAELSEYTSAGSELANWEAEAIMVKRQKLAESYKLHFESLHELGEKLAIVAGYGKALVNDWDVSPNAGKSDYVDGARTAAARHGVEQALNAYNAKQPKIPLPNLKSGGSSTPSTAPSFHDTHASELASLHSVEDPVAAHKEALDSYYHSPPTPTGTGSVTASNTRHTSATGQSGAGAMPIPGATASSSAGYTTSAASPFVQQLNTAPVSDLPPPTMSPPTGASTISPELRPVIGAHSSSGASGGSGASPVNVPTSPTSSSLAPAPSLPTVAETGAPITGTGGPAKGVLKQPDVRSGSVSSAQSKQEEARAELNRRFEEYSGHNADDGYGGPSGSGTAAAAGYSGGGEGADLDREMSLRARRDGESLPAYTSDGSGVPSAVHEKPAH